MKGLKLMLFGIAVICASGFFLVGQAIQHASESLFSWGILLGLLLSFVGLLMGTGDGNFEEDADESRNDGGSGPRDGKDGDEDADEDADGDDAPVRDHYSASRFPPM